MKIALGLTLASLALSTPAKADILAIVISEEELPYELRSSRYENSPSRYDNSSTIYKNSSTTYNNSSTRYSNSKNNYVNSASGERSIRTSEGERIGYYVWSDDGVLNIYNDSGRVLFLPSGGHTQSVFLSEGNKWCGTLGELRGEVVLGLTRNCMLRLMMD